MQLSFNPLLGSLIALILVGFFQGIEISFITANRLNIELRKKQGKRSGALLGYFVHRPAALLGTLIVITNLLIVLYGLFLTNFLEQFWSLTLLNQYARLALNVVIAALFLLVVVFFCKAVFKANADAIINNSLVVAVLSGMYSIFGKVANVLTAASEATLNLLVTKNFRNTKATINKFDLEQFIDQSRDSNATDEPNFDTDLFENALQLNDTKIRHCLIPRKEIISISSTSSIEQVKEKFIETKLSRLIVYADNIDTIIGYVHQLDLFTKPATIQQILLPITAVPESMSAGDLINKFTKDRKSIAWVVDEFGGTAGIVTMEDLLEELFGEIQDEYDTNEHTENQIAKDEYILSGRLEMDYLAETYKLYFADNESETLSGYIIQIHESIPKQKQRIIIHNYEFEILNVSETRIEMVKLKVLK